MNTFSMEAFLHQFLYDAKAPLLFQDGFFVYFFALFSACYYGFRNVNNGRAVVLSVFSLYFFYKASGWFVGLVMLAAVADFLLSNAIYRAQRISSKKALLAVSILFNLGVLFAFKYTRFFAELSNDVLGSHYAALPFLVKFGLPVGISFYTFENISYTIDVYRGEFKPERSFINYLLFLSFFPKLVMGPIVRAKDFIPQLRQPYAVSREDFSYGFYLIVSGLFKKLVISDYISTNFVDYVFDGPALHTGLECLLAVYGYAVVIYCDFSGYSDVAIGLSRWLGIHIPANFASPYQSRSITEFWRRWHISLSSWLKDYLYIFSFGGNRSMTAGSKIIAFVFFGGAAAACGYALKSSGAWWPAFLLFSLAAILVIPVLFVREKGKNISTSLNQMNTMLLGGAWHGASWNFILWGALHGAALAIHKIWLQFTGSRLEHARANRFYQLIAGGLTFHFVCFCWIFFRAGSFETAGEMIHQITHNFSFSVLGALWTNYYGVLIMIALGMGLHLLPESAPLKTAQLLERVPLVGYLAIFFLFLVSYSLFRSAVPVMPIYLQF